MPVAVSLGLLLSSTILPSASPQASSMSSLTSPAPLPQSHKCLRASGGMNNINHNSNVSNCVIAQGVGAEVEAGVVEVEPRVAEAEIIKNL